MEKTNVEAELEMESLEEMKPKKVRKWNPFLYWIAILLLSSLLTAGITSAFFFGDGLRYLAKSGILWMNREEWRDVMKDLQTTEEISGWLYQESGVDLELISGWLYQESDVDLELNFMEVLSEYGALVADLPKETVARKLGKYLLDLYSDYGWEVTRRFCEANQIQFSIYHSQGRRLGGNLPVSEEQKAWEFLFSHQNVEDDGWGKVDYHVKVWFDEEAFPYHFADRFFIQTQILWGEYRYGVAAVTIFSFLLSVLLLIAICRLVVRSGRESGGLLRRIPLEVVVGLAVWGILTCFLQVRNTIRLMGLPVWGILTYYLQIRGTISQTWVALWILVKNWLLMLVLIQALVFHVMRRKQQGQWYRYSLCYPIFMAIRKLIFAWMEIFQNLSLTWRFLLTALMIGLVEAGLILGLLPLERRTWILLGALGAGKLILLPFLLRYGLVLTKIRTAAGEIASGKLDYRLETEKMPASLRKFGEDVNAVAGSVSHAVEERLKSERLKTELITNVSHDIKTPLTSIINFSDLIEKEQTENPKIKEYAVHLHKQSTRMKKLIEDLMEASKAATGNLKANLENCDVRILLGQCLGEFEPRLREQSLELVIRQSDQPLRIMADTRMLWRVFDNLLNNICKYSQKDTRVYLSTELVGEKVQITFKNVSKYALDVSPEELLERFTRGDLSRHTEGNGLGLAIVSSLMDLQGGKIQLAVDADLFKATLEFPVAQARQVEGKKIQDGGDAEKSIGERKASEKQSERRKDQGMEGPEA